MPIERTIPITSHYGNNIPQDQAYKEAILLGLERYLIVKALAIAYVFSLIVTSLCSWLDLK